MDTRDLADADTSPSVRLLYTTLGLSTVDDAYAEAVEAAERRGWPGRWWCHDGVLRRHPDGRLTVAILSPTRVTVDTPEAISAATRIKIG